ncbi:protein SPT2 homolog [Columba livia]|uniref:protein SPT2 homolog n=1 Tax=Columba livia TaxID=8932 RepID=UPI0031B9C9D4
MEIICSGPRLRVYFDISERSHQELLKSLADASLLWGEVGISGTRGPFHHRWERAPVSHRSSRRPPRGSRRCRPEAGRAPAASVPPPLSAAPGLAQPAPAADFGGTGRCRCTRGRCVGGRLRGPRRRRRRGADRWAGPGRAGGASERACGSAAAGAGRPWVGSGAAAERRCPPHSSGGGGSPGPAIKREGAGRRALRVCWSALRRLLQKRAGEGESRRKSGRLCRATSCRPPAGIPGGRCGGTRTRGSPWLRGGGGKEAGSSAAEEDSPAPLHPAAPAGGVRSPESAGGSVEAKNKNWQKLYSVFEKMKSVLMTKHRNLENHRIPGKP